MTLPHPFKNQNDHLIIYSIYTCMLYWSLCSSICVL